ncbi:gfo/Idh/MocA family oxidoreductase [Paenibacillus nanensis]|uniref:Gfo/Idh/MocA family oxidoreductase n=1 Tax=Paenibacillus nanensis TaxID=393251 RepID=A0A3A1VIM2_9BACL|nr:Gfo/Idh/MocA family oxidoreductase [Paenibacillus nanensis]RIX59466.1 gfo/Idh/MocA family oxidoreductase [Paenibacillus nanensis]
MKIGMISYWHVHAWDYTKQALDHPGTQIAAVWDEDASRGQAAADKLGVPYFAGLDDMLAGDTVDAVIVNAPTDRHEEVMVKAAKAGKHIFTEKVIAPTLAEANRILEAVESAGVTLTVSLPRLNDPYTLAIQELLRDEVFGDLTLIRIRLSHNGAVANWLPEHFYSLEQCGGGAMIDLGCHPMYLTRLFMGSLPSSVTSQYGFVTDREVEDNAVALLQGQGGVLGVVEAGFVNPHSPFTIEVHGTKGSALFGTPDNKLLIRTADSADGWRIHPMPAQRESAFEQWVGHVNNGTAAEENIRLAKDLTMLMEAANRSYRERRTIDLAELQP